MRIDRGRLVGMVGTRGDIVLTCSSTYVLKRISKSKIYINV